MHVSQMTPEELAAGAELAIRNTLDNADLLSVLTPYRYDEAGLAEAAALVEVLKAANLRRSDLTGRKVQATQALGEAWKAFRRETFLPQSRLARILFKKDPGMKGRLGLAGGVSPRYRAGSQQALQFYEVALSDAEIQEQLLAKAITTADLQSAADRLAAMRVMDYAQANIDGQKQQATRERRTAAKKVRAWLIEFRDTARVALADKPDWLERLGFFERS